MTTIKATLPTPPSVNHRSALGVSRGRRIVYTPAAVKQWQETARLLLMAAGMRRLPEGYWAWSVDVVLRTPRMDCEAGQKDIIDVCAGILEVNDRWVYRQSSRKVWSTDAGADVTVRIYALNATKPADAKAEMNQLEAA
jgi:hypothetical protein